MGSFIIKNHKLLQLIGFILSVVVITILRTIDPYEQYQYLILDYISVIITFIFINYLLKKIFIKTEEYKVDDEYIVKKNVIDIFKLEEIVVLIYIVIVYELIKKVLRFMNINIDIIIILISLLLIILVTLLNFIRQEEKKDNSEKSDN